jgi:tetratricopeptide (TPR) repeat protein
MSLEKVDGPARLGRAWLHARCERWDLARADYEEVLNQDEMNEAAWLRLALLPEGYLTAERASQKSSTAVLPVKGDGLASQLFVKANLLRHLQRYRESFEILRQANDVRLARYRNPMMAQHFDRLLQNAQTWSPSRIEHEHTLGTGQSCLWFSGLPAAASPLWRGSSAATRLQARFRRQSRKFCEALPEKFRQ